MILKNKLQILLCLLITATSCSKGSPSLPAFDYKTEYSSKEFLYHDNFSFKYIPVETDSLLIDRSQVVYMCNDSTIILTGKDYKFVTIDASGKILSSFSRAGNASGEYLGVTDVFYDEKQKEFVILDSQKKRVLILDNRGYYKREIPIEKGHNANAIMNLNDQAFLTYNCSLGLQEDLHGSYSVVSKTDGTIIKDIVMNCEGEKRYPSVINLPKFINIYKTNHMIPGDDYVVLSEAYCDTIYKMDRKDFSLQPYFVKTPAFNTLPNPDKFFLCPCIDTPEYMMFIKYHVTYDNDGAKMVSEEFFYDKKEGKFYKSSNKYLNKDTLGPFSKIKYKDYGSLGYTLDIVDLYKMEEAGILDEKLKPILEKADENDNPVLVLTNFETNK